MHVLLLFPLRVTEWTTILILKIWMSPFSILGESAGACLFHLSMKIAWVRSHIIAASHLVLYSKFAYSMPGLY